MHIVQWLGGWDTALLFAAAWLAGIVLIAIVIIENIKRPSPRAVTPTEVMDTIRRTDERMRAECEAKGHLYRMLPGVGWVCLSCGQHSNRSTAKRISQEVQ